MVQGDERIRGSRRRLLVGAVALGAAAIGLTSSVFPASASTDSEVPSHTTVVECTSGTITQGDVQMSAAFAGRVPVGEHPDLPGGCVQTG
jgi:hypothetical protein